MSPGAGWQAGLRESATSFGIQLCERDLGLLAEFTGLLRQHNARFSLTTITDPAEIAVKHFLDSLLCLAVLPENVAGLCDVGSGAGFPGIPLAIARPQLAVTLLEATRKKCRFLELCVAELGLANARVICARAEDAGRNPALREAFEVVVSRAVASLAVLAELCLPLTAMSGVFVAMKGPEGQSEAGEAGAAISALGGELELVRALALPGNAGRRALLVIRKIAATPEKYPRRPGIPQKRPLR